MLRAASTTGTISAQVRAHMVLGGFGTQDLYLRFSGGSGYLLNVNWWQFRR